MDKRRQIARTVLLIASVLGIATSVYLTTVHIDVQLEGQASGLCNLGEGLNCTGAARSSYAKIFGVPIAVLGLGFYIAAAVLSLLAMVRKSDTSDEHPVGDGSGLLVTLYGGAVAYSVFLAVISVTVLDSLCPGCLALYAVNVLGLGAAWIWYGAPPHTAIARQLGSFGELTRSVPVVVFAMAFVLGAFVPNLLVQMRLSNAGVGAAEPLGERIDEELLTADHAPTWGDPDAPVTIVEFSDFQCPFCSRLATTMHTVVEEFEDEVYLVFRNFPLSFHEHAEGAARAAVCANEQGKFWEMHDLMFDNQSHLDEDNLLELASEAGLDVNALEDCMQTDYAAGLVAEDVATGEQVGVSGTPAFFINGTPYAGAYPYEDIAGLIREALEEGE